MREIRFQCPACGATLVDRNPELVGTVGNCPKCRKSIFLPQAGNSVPSPTETPWDQDFDLPLAEDRAPLRRGPSTPLPERTGAANEAPKSQTPMQAKATVAAVPTKVPEKIGQGDGGLAEFDLTGPAKTGKTEAPENRRPSTSETLKDQACGKVTLPEVAPSPEDGAQTSNRRSNKRRPYIVAAIAGAAGLILLAAAGIALVDPSDSDKRSSSLPKRSEPRQHPLRPLPPDPVGENVPATGFVVDPGGFILTSAQLAEDPASIMVRLTGLKEPVAATLVSADKVNDLALLRIPLSVGISLKPLPICQRDTAEKADRKLRPFEEIAIWGYPAGDTAATAAIPKPGLLTELAGPATVQLLKIVPSVPPEPGNAGSPFCDHFGNVIGMFVTNPTENAEDGKTGYVMPGSRLVPFLSKSLKDFKPADPLTQKKDWADINFMVAPSLAMVFKKGHESDKPALPKK
jgi:Trypsin-like peptidase domain